jgi:Domain of unknown function (DUF4082)/PEP-CTERM motif
MTKIHKMMLRAGFAAMLTMPTAAFAAPVVTLSSPGAEYNGGSYTLGFEFSVNSAGLAIDKLGVYDNLGDGLASSAQIGLWDISGNLLTFVTIGAGLGTLDNLFRFQSIIPYSLTAGQHYVVGAFTTDLASSLGTGQGGSGTVDPNVTIYQDRFSNFNNAFSFADTSNNNVGGAWLGGNFTLTGTGAVPEPASWALMLTGFGLVGGAMRRRVTKVSYAA